MPSITFSNPPGAPQPQSSYSQAVLIEGSARRLVISGQIGLRPDGTLAGAAGEQMAAALGNLGAILAAHGMAATDIVKMTVFLTDAALIPDWRRHREGFLKGHPCTSTLLIVAGLAHPDFVVEVEAEAVAA